MARICIGLAPGRVKAISHLANETGLTCQSGTSGASRLEHQLEPASLQFPTWEGQQEMARRGGLEFAPEHQSLEGGLYVCLSADTATGGSAGSTLHSIRASPLRLRHPIFALDRLRRSGLLVLLDRFSLVTERAARKLASQRLEPAPLLPAHTRVGAFEGRLKVSHRYPWRLRNCFRAVARSRGGCSGVRSLRSNVHCRSVEVDRGKHLAQSRDGRFARERRQVCAREAIGFRRSRDPLEVDVVGERGLARDGAENLDSFGRRRQIDVEELVESAGTAHGWVEDIGPVGGADDKDLLARLEAVELGEEGVDETCGRFRLVKKGVVSSAAE